MVMVLAVATVEERRQYLYGYVTGVFRIVDMVEAALPGLDRQDIALRIEDATATAGEHLLYDNPGRAPGGSSPEHDTTPGQRPISMHLDSTMELAGRRWVLRFAPTLEFLAAQQSAQP
jgi:hypothetical protein